MVERLVLVATEPIGRKSNLVQKMLPCFTRGNVFSGQHGFQAVYRTLYHERNIKYYPVYTLMCYVVLIWLVLRSVITTILSDTSVQRTRRLSSKQQHQLQVQRFHSYCQHDASVGLQKIDKEKTCRVMVCYSADDGVVHEKSALCMFEDLMPTNSTIHDFDGGHQVFWCRCLTFS